MNEVSAKRRKGLYDFVIAILIITSLGFYDIKWLFLGVQGLAIGISFFRLLLGSEKIGNYWTKYLAWVIFFAGFSALSKVWAQEINVTVMTCTISIIQVGLVSLSIQIYCNDRERALFVVNAFILTAICLCVRFFITIPASLWGQQARFSKDSIFGGNSPAMVLAYAAVLIIWKLYADKQTDSKKRILWNLLLICAFMFVSMMMGTKKGLIIFGLGFGIVMISNSKNPVAFMGRMIAIIAAVAVVYLLIMKVEILYNSIGYRFESMVMGFAGGETDTSTEMRMLFVEDALNVFKENPFRGIGQDGYRYVNRYQFTYSHTNYAEILANLGLVGFVIYYYMYYYILKRAIWMRKREVLPLMLIAIMFILDMSVISYSDEIGSMVLTLAFIFSTVADSKS